MDRGEGEQSSHRTVSIINLVGMHLIDKSQGTKLASWCLKNLGDYLKKSQLLGIVYLSNVAEKF
jgi:hypothetical protein